MKPLLEVKQLSVCYGTEWALKDVSFNLTPGEFLAVMGPNGGGKTTLARAVLGLLPRRNGVVNLNTRRIGYVPQSTAVDRNFPITVSEVVKSALCPPGLRPHLRPSAAKKEQIQSCLARVGLGAYANRPVSDLSGGEFQRLLIARALVCNPELLLLDEPTANIDPISREQIYKVLKGLLPQTTILMVTHDLSVLNGTVSRLLCLGETVLYDGKPTLTSQRLHTLYGFPPLGISPCIGGEDHD